MSKDGIEPAAQYYRGVASEGRACGSDRCPTRGARANCVAFSPDGLTCAVGSGANKFCVFDLDR